MRLEELLYFALFSYGILFFCLVGVRPARGHPPARGGGQSEQDHVCTGIFSFPSSATPAGSEVEVLRGNPEPQYL